MYLAGMGGTGKSQVLKALVEFFKLRNESHRIIIIALTCIRKFGKVRFSNMMFMNPSQHYNTQIIVYNHVSVTYKDYSNVIN